MIPIRLAAFNPCVTRSSFFAPTFCPAYVAIVPPSASNGQQKNMLTLLPVETAATAMDPSEFTAV